MFQFSPDTSTCSYVPPEQGVGGGGGGVGEGLPQSPKVQRPALPPVCREDT